MTRIIASLTAAAALAGTLALSALPSTAQEQAAPMCGARNDIVAKLASIYSEAPQAVGVVDKSAVLEIFVSSKGTWTIISTSTDGTSCVVSAGEGWEATNFVKGRDA